MASSARRLLVTLGLLALTMCSEVATQPSPLLSASGPTGSAYVLENTVKARPSGGRSRELRQGSVWTEFGTVAEGTVYKPRGMVLTAEGVNESEAYIVVRDGSWVGFWLPAEKAFSPVKAPVPIMMKKGEEQ